MNSKNDAARPDSDECHIIFDVDGVILDWVSAFMVWAKENYGLEASVSPADIRSFNLTEYFSHHSQFSKEMFSRLVVEFSRSPDFKRIRSFKGAADFLEDLNGIGIKIHAVTACGCEIARQGREQCLSQQVDWQPEWPIHVLPLGASKKEILSTFPVGRTIFIDDLYRNVSDARDAGLFAIWHKSAGDTLYRDMGEHHEEELHTSAWEDLRAEIFGQLLRFNPQLANRFNIFSALKDGDFRFLG